MASFLSFLNQNFSIPIYILKLYFSWLHTHKTVPCKVPVSSAHLPCFQFLHSHPFCRFKQYRKCVSYRMFCAHKFRIFSKTPTKPTAVTVFCIVVRKYKKKHRFDTPYVYYFCKLSLRTNHFIKLP